MTIYDTNQGVKMLQKVDILGLQNLTFWVKKS